jgi:hypothetical protein
LNISFANILEKFDKYSMTLSEFLIEKKVQSTWIASLSLNRKSRIITMILNTGKKYTIPGMSRVAFDKWNASPSKGQYFHANIAGRYNVHRI